MYNIYVGLEFLGDCNKKKEKYTTLQVEVNKMHERFNNRSFKKRRGGGKKVRLESISRGFTKSREERYRPICRGEVE